MGEKWDLQGICYGLAWDLLIHSKTEEGKVAFGWIVRPYFTKNLPLFSEYQWEARNHFFYTDNFAVSKNIITFA